MTKYKKSIAFLYTQLPIFQRVGQKAYKSDLLNTQKLLKSLGNPEKSFKTIHVAGTNGKGSVSTMLSEILRKNHYNVGLYTSPHLRDFRERIRISGKKVSKKYVKEFIADHKEQWKGISPSFFEITVAMAFDYFAKNKVDIAIIEVGLGGRLDSTNVIDPELSIITRIGMDHQQFLGDTIEEIATEKAGIIKPKRPLVLGENLDSVKEVIEDEAGKQESEIHYAEPYTGHLSIQIPEYQRENMGTVQKACEVLNLQGLKIDLSKVSKQMKKTLVGKKIKGRWQVLQESPLVIADAAHNENGIKALTKQLAKMDCKSLHIVFGTVNDKDPSNILSLMPKLATYYFCKADIPRGMNAIELKDYASKHGLQGSSYTSVMGAFEAAKSSAESEDLVLVTGSIFVIAEVV